MKTLLQGDRHNGKFVHELPDGYFFKPRPIFWEWLFLSNETPLSPLFTKIARNSSLPATPLCIIPRLSFQDIGDNFLFGKVEKAKAEPLTKQHLSLPDAERLGAFIACMTSFGITDLIASNILVGEQQGSAVIYPFDIESVLNNTRFIWQTGLIDSTLSVKSGLSPLLPALNSTIDATILSALLTSYISWTEVLKEHSEDIYETIANISAPTTPSLTSRVIPRNSAQYLTPQTASPPLSSSEIEQLTRNDIPYFFRHIDSNEILYLTHNNKKAPANLDPGLSNRLMSEFWPFQKIAKNTSDESLLAGVTFLTTLFTAIPECKITPYNMEVSIERSKVTASIPGRKLKISANRKKGNVS